MCFCGDAFPFVLHLRVGYDQGADADLLRGLFDFGEAGVLADAFEFREGVCVAGRSGCEHHHAEGGGGWWSDAVGVGDEFDDCGSATGFEGNVHLAHESGAGGRVEVVEEVGYEHEVIASAEVGLEGVAGNEMVSVTNPHGLRVPRCDFEDVLPIGGIDCG